MSLEKGGEDGKSGQLMLTSRDFSTEEARRPGRQLVLSLPLAICPVARSSISLLRVLPSDPLLTVPSRSTMSLRWPSSLLPIASPLRRVATPRPRPVPRPSSNSLATVSKSKHGACKRSFCTATGSQVPGMLTLSQLKTLASERQIDTVYMAFTDHMGRQMGKRFDVDFFLQEGVSGSYACDYLLTVDIDFNIIPGFSFSNWCVSLASPLFVLPYILSTVCRLVSC